MNQVEKWRWRIRWAGRWTTTATHQSEEEVRREHPEAERIDGSRIVVEVPDSAGEVAAAHRQPQRRRDATGRILKMWEE